jgi:hypothetical protein
MKKTIFFLIVIFNTFFVKSQVENLIKFDYVESFDWFGAWWFNNPTTGYFSDISVTPTLSAGIFGSGNNTYEQDWYALPTVTVDPTQDHIFRMRLAAQTISSPGAATAGLDGGDYITVQLSQDGGTYVSELRVAGFSNATWDYSSTAVASKVADGSITQFRPSSGGDRTLLGDGYSYIELIIPAGPTTIAIDVQARANRPGEDWWMDNFELFELTTLLPVELISFNGKEENGVNVLKWSTASELNSDFFEVEWSRDAIDWNTIGKMQAAGNSNFLLDYQFVHENFMSGINYYRLVQYDFNGDFETFNIISIDNTQRKDKSIEGYFNAIGQEIILDEHRGVYMIKYRDGTFKKGYKLSN